MKFFRQERRTRDGSLQACIRVRSANAPPCGCPGCNAEKSSICNHRSSIHTPCPWRFGRRSLHLSSCVAASQLSTIMPQQLSAARWRTLCKRRSDRATNRSYSMIPHGQDHVLSTPVPQMRKLWHCIRGTAYLKLEIHNSAIWLGRGKRQVEAGRDARHDSQFKTSSCDGKQ